MRKILLVLVIFILCAPLPLSIIKYIFPEKRMEIPLEGTLEVPDRPTPSIKNIFNGSLQNYYDKYFSYNMAGRATMTRVYNEVLYGFFYSSSNPTIMMGKDKYLYEFVYTNAYLEEPDNDKKNEFFDKLIQLALLQRKIEETGKFLFVIITPSKASFYPEYLPDAFTPYIAMKDRGEYAQNYYEYFVSRVSETGLRYFDFHDEFLELKKNGTDIFTKGGIHWTGPAVASYSSELINAMNKNTEKTLGNIQTINTVPVWGNAFTSDDDLERLLNIFPAYSNLPGKIRRILPSYLYQHIIPRCQFYSDHMECLSIPTDYQPSVFVCGGSFVSNWLLLVYGLWDWVTLGDGPVFSSAEYSFYNSYVIKSPEFTRISETTDDFNSVMEKDIIIIELNEESMDPDVPQFTFVKNLLDFLEEKRN